MAGTKLVLETGIGPLGPGSDTVPDALRSDEAAHAQRPGLALHLLLQPRVAMRVDADDQDVAQGLARLVDLLRAIGCVHQVVETGHAAGGDLRKWYRSLAVMAGGQRQQGLTGTSQSAVSR